MPLQIAQVQVSTELLEVSRMDSKDSSPKTVLPLPGLPKELACCRPPAAGLPAAIAATGSKIILITVVRIISRVHSDGAVNT